MASRDTARDKKNAAEVEGIVMYEDEAIFQQSGTTTRTWAPVGTGTPVKSFPTRKAEKVFGAIGIDADKPRWHFYFAEVFNSGTFLRFLQQVVRFNQERKVFMIADNASYHKTKKVHDWLEANKEKIVLYYLPAYSPELNATERVWRVTRRKATHNCYFPHRSVLHKKLFRRFNRYQGNPASLRGVVNAFL